MDTGVYVFTESCSASKSGPHFKGTDKPWTKSATSNSKYTKIDPKTGKATQTAVYDSNGNVVGHDVFPEPGNPASGHGKGKPHIPNSDLPSDWSNLPSGIEPHTPIGR